jgi:hypothetical protein
MSTKAVGLPPPPGIDNIQPSGRDRVMGAVGGILNIGSDEDFSSTPIGKQLEQHHKAQVSQAEMYWKLAQTAGGEIATKKDSATGRDLTPEEIESRQHQYQAAMDAYGKIVGVNKETKAAHGKARMVLDHLLGRGQGQPQQGAQPQPQGQVPPAGAGSLGGGPPAPPTASASAGAGAGIGAAPATATKGMPAPPNRMSPEQMASVYPSPQVQGEQSFNADARMEELKHKHRMEEVQVKPKHLQKVPVKGPDNKPVMANFDPTTGTYTDPNGNAIDNPEPYIKPSTAMMGKLAWTTRNGQPVSVMRDPQTNQIIPGSENPDILPPAYMTEHIHEGEFTWRDEDGNIHRSATTSTTKPVLPRTGGVPKPPARGAGVPARPAAASNAPTGDRIVGKGESQSDHLVRSNAVKLANTAKPMVDILEASEDYIREGKFTPRQDLAVIVRAVRAMNPGSVRLPQRELEMEIKAGSFGDRFKRWYENASSGLLPADQRTDLMNVIRTETQQIAKSAADNWEQAFEGKKQLPPYLTRFSTKSQGGGKKVVRYKLVNGALVPE